MPVEGAIIARNDRFSRIKCAGGLGYGSSWTFGGWYGWGICKC